MINPYTEAMAQILKEVVNRKGFFKKKPKALAYLMQWYSHLHYASRFDPNKELHDWENLKYAILDLDKVVDSIYADFVYFAWGATIDYESKRSYGKPHKLESKKNKTVQDWVKLCLDPKYRFHSLYPNRIKVIEKLLCHYGTGFTWNQEGFLSDPDGEGIFYGYETVGFKQLPKALKDLTVQWKRNTTIALGFKNWKIAIKQEQEEKKKADQALEYLQKKYKIPVEKLVKAEETVYPMSKYSPLTLMPTNAHPSYIKAGKEICELILSNPNESKENIRFAKKFMKSY